MGRKRVYNRAHGFRTENTESREHDLIVSPLQDPIGCFPHRLLLSRQSQPILYLQLFRCPQSLDLGEHRDHRKEEDLSERQRCRCQAGLL